MADGILTVAAAAAPPPPPGATATHFFDTLRAPPPPPSVKHHAWAIWVRETVFPLTEAVCSGATGEGHVHRLACDAFLSEVGTWKHINGVGTVAPLCDSVCWHGCTGSHTGSRNHDSFRECKQPECATSSCYDFLLGACQPIQHHKISTAWKTTCSITPPSPPAPPAPPPLPPAPPVGPSPRAPPPYIKFTSRKRDDELDTDPDCELLPYASCQASLGM